jgi:hypothetical protein
MALVGMAVIGKWIADWSSSHRPSGRDIPGLLLRQVPDRFLGENEFFNLASHVAITSSCAIYSEASVQNIYY